MQYTIDMDNISAKIEQMNKQLAKLGKAPIRNSRKIKDTILKIQATEAVRDIYTTQATGITGNRSGDYCVNKNNYPTYQSMVATAYDMYQNRTDYGGELYGALVASRVAFIGGEGPTAISDNKKVEKWANNWLKINKLDGDRNIRFLEGGELEGKYLMRLYPTPNPPKWLNDGEPFVSVQGLHWQTINYNIEKDPTNSDIIKKIWYVEKGEKGEAKTIPADTSVYVQLGGIDVNSNETVYALMRCLTQIEGASRALYDLNHISAIYGFPKPVIEMKESATNKEITAITDHYNEAQRPPNEMLVSKGRHYYSTPGPGGVEPILENLKGNLRFISFNSDLPILMIVWPELMSNRATANTIMELINNKTATPRSIWEGGYKELIYKARELTVKMGALPKGMTEEEFLSADIRVKMPLASFEVLKQILNVWLPLFNNNIVGKNTLRNMIPGIDPAEEKEMETTEENNNGDDSELPGDTGNENGEEQGGPQGSN